MEKRRSMRPSRTVFCGLILSSICAPAALATPSFPPGAIWNQDISAQSPDPNSAKMTAASVGWGTGTTSFQIDFSMHTLYTAGQSVTQTPLVEESGYYLPDCDTGVTVPLPAIGAIEGSNNYSCDIANNDCHLFVVDGSTLYESYQTTVDAGGVHSLCLVKWRLDLVYPQNGRGDGCTSADAAGFPMSPLIFGPDEVHAAMLAGGDLGHAIRFILPNSRMRRGAYVYPASHNGAPSSSSPDAIPYGAHLRLQAGFDISHFNPAAQVILRTLKKYGMFLSDGGNLPLTADDGLFSVHKWTDSDIAIDSHSLFGVALSNFDVMPLGSVIAYSNSSPSAECVRNHFGEGTTSSDPHRFRNGHVLPRPPVWPRQ
jgi:serine/threonine-protein kinase